jgi:hypothetical protein
MARVLEDPRIAASHHAPLPVPLRHPLQLGSLELADRSNTPLQPPQLGEGHRILFAAPRESLDSQKLENALATISHEPGKEHCRSYSEERTNSHNAHHRPDSEVRAGNKMAAETISD